MRMRTLLKIMNANLMNPLKDFAKKEEHNNAQNKSVLNSSYLTPLIYMLVGTKKKRSLLKTILDQFNHSSFRIRSQIRTATPNQRRSKRTQSHMKETKILLDICPKQCFNYPIPAFKTKQFSQKEQIKYFQGFYDRDEKQFDWMSNLLQVRKIKR
ncbi:unnamed protein product (macronuclear) [Paramecium tetraurelia]|uniref:Uncharacterized protein n=1 Tax=Paramecium tetraurelia TaxID=5888 RepID=A0DEN3_PARTE|nr:uncharacterized protein GSPATT00016326001 [Paramecium tetraurelia]CAK81500.1 unnamed protein product [Paramecium tetraurelia]|eukprot:XP_001448897.1 hypothetical protein (macronuclear) [Paramecium tetraurelia strain d4-2]